MTTIDVFSVLVGHHDDGGRIIVEGELDSSVVERFRAALVRLVRDGERQIDIDLSGVTFMDSTGVGALVSAVKEVGRYGGSLWVSRPSRPVRAVLDVTGLSQLVPVR